MIHPCSSLAADAHVSDEAMLELDAGFARSSERGWRRLVAWAGVLDAAGWCVVLVHPGGLTWTSANAAKDLAARRGLPGGTDVEERVAELVPVQAITRGVWVWSAALEEVAATELSSQLTRREREVFGWLRAGKSDAEIALILGCAVRTVEKHVANLYRKLGVGSRAEAILHFYDLGF